MSSGAHDTPQPSPWRWLAPIVLVLGVALCAAGLERLVAREAIALEWRALPLAAAVLAALATLLLGGCAWRALLRAASREVLGVREAIAQVGLLLIGKYVPGGITGVLARVAANAGRVPARAVLLATLLEQVGAVVIGAIVVGELLAWRFGGVGLALLSLVSGFGGAVLLGPALLRALAARSRHAREWLQRAAEVDRAALATGLAFQLGQWLALMALVVAIAAMALPGLDAARAERLAEGYAIAMLAGILALVFPGGIGPREATFAWCTAGVLGAEPALAIALAMRMATTATDLLGGLLYLGYRVRTPRTP